MKTKPSKHLPPKPYALLLHLIREELKSRKFFSGLQKLGLDYCYYQPQLDKPILSALGFEEPSDEVYKFYFKLIEKQSRKIREDEESITRQAEKVYQEFAEACERFEKSERLERWSGLLCPPKLEWNVRSNVGGKV